VEAGSDARAGEEPRTNARLGVLFLVAFLDLLGFGILIPQLGIYAVKFQAAPFTVGLLLSVYSLMQLLFAPVLGRLSDRVGRRPVLLYSIAGSAVGYVLFGFAQSLGLLFLSRIIDGISGGNISTAQAYVADVTTGEDRARGMGVIGAAFGLGFILGPALGGVLGAAWGNLGIGLFAAALCAINWVLAFALLPESRKPGSVTRTKSVALVLPMLRVPVVGLGLVLFLVFTTAFAQMEGTFSVFLVNRHLSAPAIELAGRLWEIEARLGAAVVREASLRAGYIFLVVGIVSTVIQGGLIGRLRKRFGEPALVITGCALLVVSLAAVPLAPSYGALFAPMVLLAAGSGLTNPSLSALVSLHAPAGSQGEVLGAYQSMGALGRIVGPALGGFLFSVGGASAPYVVASSMMAAALLLAAVLRHRVRAAPRAAGAH
jgi:MFS transporter, DHA1 family, tetracycline resistance protein